MKKLKSQQVRSARYEGERLKLYDGGGLYLHVIKSGPVWRYDYQFNKKRKTLTIGRLADLSLSQARDRHQEAMGLLRTERIDPSEQKRSAIRRKEAIESDTFSSIAAEWLGNQTDWVASHKSKVKLRIDNDALPVLGSIAVTEISTSEVLKCLRAVESRGAIDSAHRLKQSISAIFRFAIATGRADSDPTVPLRGALKSVRKKSYPHLTDPIRLGQVLKTIDDYSGSLEVRSALQLAPMVFVRSGELRHAEWIEIDFTRSLWTIPANRMKRSDNGNHLVPLSKQAIKVLKRLRKHTGHLRLVFPGQRSRERPISDNSLNAALRRLDVSKDELVIHGFRHTASTLLNEMRGVDPDLIEVQLHHADRSMRGKYNKAQYLEARTQMMVDWSDYLESLKVGA